MPKDGSLKWALMLSLLLVGVLSQYWDVDQQQHVCAVKGSSVVIPCSYVYPVGRRVQSVMWSHGKHHFYNGPFIYNGEEKPDSTKFQYVGDKVKNCSLKIRQVEHNDSGEYAFRFITVYSSGKDNFTSKNPSFLQIVDLEITATKSNGATKEGDSLNLTCLNGCDGGKLSSAFRWFKNGKFIKQGAQLSFGNISFTNSGIYTCSLENHAGTTSGILHIDVEYGPKNTSVSATQSADADANVTLVCSSDANPPVKSYTWFKMHTADNIMCVAHKTPKYIVEIMPNDDVQYFCMATNKHGSQNSSILTLGVKGHFSSVQGQQPPVILIIITVFASLFTLIIALAIRRCNKKRISSSATECGVEAQSQQNTDYINWPVNSIHSSQIQCGGETLYATLDFNMCKKSDTVQQVDFLHDSVTYSSVCRT